MTSLVHTCLRVRDPELSVTFYLGLPGDGDKLELTINVGRDEPYDLGDAFNHIAVTVDDIDATLAAFAEIGVEPEKPPYHPGDRDDLPRIAFVADPDGYRVELIDGGRFDTPQDPAR
jgi:lactoylglutathione lyase